MNVLADETGRAELARLGARSVPVVARGDRFVFAQVIGDVVEFLGLDEDATPELSPAALATRCEHVLATAARLAAQMPETALENELPNRPRSWRVLLHHVFQIPAAFLDAEETGEPLLYENLVKPPPESMRTGTDIAAFGDSVRSRFARWWETAHDEDFERQVPTYFGGTTRHEMLERTVWHAAQHTRQVASLLELAGVEPDGPLGPKDVEGLPLTDRIWD